MLFRSRYVSCDLTLHEHRAGHRHQPSITSSSDLGNEPDQCIFIQYYNMKKQFVWKRPMKAAAGPDVLPDQEEEDDKSSARAVLSAEFAESDYAGHEPHQLPASSVSQSHMTEIVVD